MIATNFANPDKGKVALNLIINLNYKLKGLIEWLNEDSDKDK
jgi:hypothetical protein